MIPIETITKIRSIGLCKDAKMIRIFLKPVFALLIWAVLSGGLLGFYLKGLEFAGSIYTHLVVGLLSFSYAFRQKDQTKTAKMGVVPLQGFEEVLAILEPAANQVIRVGIVRQSGNEERAFLVEERDHALNEVYKLFNRKKSTK